MSDDAGRALLDLLRREVVALLDEGRRAVDAANVLPALGPAGADWAGTGLEDRLLAPAPDVGGNPLATVVLGGLHALSAPGQAGLFGWDPDPAAHAEPRGIAWAARAPGAGAAVAVVGAAGGPVVDVVAGGTGSVTIAIGPAWTLSLDVVAPGGLGVRVAPSGAVAVRAGAPGAVLRATLARPSPPDAGGGPGIALGAVQLRGELRIDAAGVPGFDAAMRVAGGAIRLAPGAFSALVPGLGAVPLDADLRADPARGVTLGGSPALRARLPAGASVPGLSVGPVDVELTPEDGAVGVQVGVGVAASLPGAPIALTLEGVGLALPFRLGAGGGLGFDPASLVPADPTGAGADVDLPIVRAAGRLEREGPSEYAGMLAAEVPPMAASAFGVLGLPGAGSGLSFLVILAATFPPPGIQLGFGFAVGGVGGIVGVGRRVDPDALARAVADGTAVQLLFPSDPAKAADTVVPRLAGLFPAAPGHVVAGPMFELTWGGRIVTAALAVVVDLPDPVRIAVLGKVVVALPDPELPLVLLQAGVLGLVDASEPSVLIFASLAGSTIVGLPLTGDLLLLIRGGDDPAFVLSAGGFHPRFSPPRGVPALARLGMDLSPAAFLDLRCQAYFAVTSNTIQFGAHLELDASVAGCGLHGHLGFDALIGWDPFRFLADASAGIAVEVAGEELVGVHLDLALEGPAPWRARGHGSVDLFLFSASFSFDETWGAPPPAPLATPDVAGVLAGALAAREAWVLRPPDPAAAPVQLTAEAGRSLAAGEVLHPHGRLTARQRLVPLAVTLGRFQGVPVAAQRWDVDHPALAAGQPAEGATEVREEFPAGQFLALSDDEQLGRPAFESFRAGLELVAGEVVTAAPRDCDLAFETKVIADETTSALELTDATALAEALTVGAALAADHPLWWQPPPDRVTVGAGPPPVAVADAWALRLAPDAPLPEAASVAEAHEAAAGVLAADPARRVAVVEAWEAAA